MLLALITNTTSTRNASWLRTPVPKVPKKESTESKEDKAAINNRLKESVKFSKLSPENSWKELHPLKKSTDELRKRCIERLGRQHRDLAYSCYSSWRSDGAGFRDINSLLSGRSQKKQPPDASARQGPVVMGPELTIKDQRVHATSWVESNLSNMKHGVPVINQNSSTVIERKTQNQKILRQKDFFPWTLRNSCFQHKKIETRERVLQSEKGQNSTSNCLKTQKI